MADWPNVPAGNYKLMAVAIDDSGLQTNSIPVPITVLARPANAPAMTVYFGTNQLPSGSGLNFGLVLTNTINTATLTISNSGGGILTNWLNAPSASVFYLTNPPAAVGDPFIMTAGQTKTVKVVLQDAYPESDATVLQIDNNDQGQWSPSSSDCNPIGHFRLSLTGTTTNYSGPPTVVMNYPTAGSSFVAPGSLSLQATATASGGADVNAVDFYYVLTNGYAFIGRGSANGNIYTYSWTGVPVGAYSLVALASDSFGRATLSAPVTANVLLRPVNSPIMQVFLGTNLIPNLTTINSGISTVGTPRYTMLTISNPGVSTLVLSNYLFVNDSYNAYSLSNRPAFPIRIAANSATNIFAMFNPGVPTGLCSGALIITNGDAASNPFIITNLGRANPAGTPPAVAVTTPAANRSVIGRSASPRHPPRRPASTFRPWSFTCRCRAAAILIWGRAASRRIICSRSPGPVTIIRSRQAIIPSWPWPLTATACRQFRRVCRLSSPCAAPHRPR